jgi:hypothetical protein
MIVLSPMSVFQSTHKDDAAAHAALVRTSALNLALSFSMAEMAGRTSITSENLVGARILANIFLNLAEKPEPPKQMLPNKELGAGSVFDAFKDKQPKK